MQWNVILRLLVQNTPRKVNEMMEPKRMCSTKEWRHHCTSESYSTFVSYLFKWHFFWSFLFQWSLKNILSVDQGRSQPHSSGVPWVSGARGKKWNQCPFFPDFFTHNSKMVDPKLISVIFKKWKEKKNKTKQNKTKQKSYISQSSKVFKGLHGFTRSHKPTGSENYFLNFLTFCVF